MTFPDDFRDRGVSNYREGVKNAALGFPGGKNRVILGASWPVSRVIEAAWGTVYNPHSALDSQIAAASKSIADTFSEIDSSLDKGKTIKEALYGRRVTAAMHRVIASARLHGFLHGAERSKKHMPANYGTVIRADAEKRAAEVNRLMRRTSKKVLRNTPDSDYVLSPDRALMAARYEAGKSYFQGVGDALRGSHHKKRWITSSAESCENCEDNAEIGPIDIDEVFPSGDDYPLAHQNCSCYVSVTK